MAISGMEPEIRLPMLDERPWGLFTQVVPRFSAVVDGADRTAFGVQYFCRSPYEPQVFSFDCDTEETVDGNVDFGQVKQSAVNLHNLIECATLGWPASELHDLVMRDADVVLSAALTIAATSDINDNLNLADDSDTLAAGGDVGEAVAVIEMGLADVISNQRGYIFLSLSHLQEAFNVGAVMLVGNRLVSPAGHWVIVDAGHQGDDTLYGTGPITYSVTGVQDVAGRLGQLDPNRNLLRWIENRYAVVAFCPALSVSTTITG